MFVCVCVFIVNDDDCANTQGHEVYLGSVRFHQNHARVAPTYTPISVRNREYRRRRRRRRR